jgi:hypothetical protein
MKSGPSDVRESTELLVHTFLDAALRALDILALTSDIRRTVTVEQATEHGFQPTSPDRITNQFWVCASFSTDRLVGELTYGDTEMIIEVMVGVRARGAKPTLYSLQEWLLALEVAERRPMGGLFVVRSEHIREIVAGIGAVLAANAAAIAAASASVFARLDEGRAAAQASYEEQLRRENHSRAAARAAEAFRAGDYRRVIALLEPLEGDLTPAERKKLALAKRAV